MRWLLILGGLLVQGLAVTLALKFVLRAPSELGLDVVRCEYVQAAEYKAHAGQPGARLVFWVNVAGEARGLSPDLTAACEARLGDLAPLSGFVWSDEWVRVSDLPPTRYGLEAFRRLMFEVDDKAFGLRWKRTEVLRQLEVGATLQLQVFVSTKMRRIAQSDWISTAEFSQELQRILR